MFKKSIKENMLVADGGESSSTHKPTAEDLDYEFARQLQEQEDADAAALSTGPANGRSMPPISSSEASSHSSAYPEIIREDLEYVQEFAKDIMRARCRKCNTELIAGFRGSEWLQRWQTALKRNEVFSFPAAKCGVKSCGAMTCVGCAGEPRIGKHTAEFDGEVVDWCCSDGRLFAIWILLSKYDRMELDVQARSAEKSLTTSNRSIGKTSKGTGYGKYRTYSLYETGDPSSAFFGGHGQSHQALDFRQADDKTDNLTMKILGLITALLPLKDQKVDPTLTALIELSLIHDKTAQLLRNDSLQDAMKREGLYHKLLDFVDSAGSHQHIEFLVLEERYVKKQSAGLMALSAGSIGHGNSVQLLELSEDGTAPSLISCMKNLATQSKMLLQGSHAAEREFKSSSGRATLKLAGRIIEVYDTLAPRKSRKRKDDKKGDKISAWADYNKRHAINMEDNVIGYLSRSLQDHARFLGYSPRERLKWLVTETAEMSTSLPPNIFVKVDSVRPDVMKCLIVGPDDTPYAGGLFEFDILCPAEYPMVPPMVEFRTTGGGRVDFNPNLYAGGKANSMFEPTRNVAGSPEMQWQPRKSTIMSVLISIQAMILNETPWENEPGAEICDRITKRSSDKYNCRRQAMTIRFAMLDWLKRQDMRLGLWADIVGKYFQLNHDKILATAMTWAQTNKEIEHYGGETTSMTRGGFYRPQNLLEDVQRLLDRNSAEIQQRATTSKMKEMSLRRSDR